MQNNVLDVQRSGNPGYVVGLPIRGGTVVTTEIDSKTYTAMSENNPGLSIMGSGTCNGVSNATISKFGFDTSTICSMSLSQNDFETLCTSDKIPNELLLSSTHVGKFGSSDPLRVQEWLEIETTLPSDTSPVYANGKCTNLVGIKVLVINVFIVHLLGF